LAKGAGYLPDSKTGTVIDGYIGDACPDDNWWCKMDTYHLDISKSYLDSMSLTDGWNGRKINWEYTDQTPEGCALFARMSML
jgi:hypothetical protein